MPVRSKQLNKYTTNCLFWFELNIVIPFYYAYQEFINNINDLCMYFMLFGKHFDYQLPQVSAYNKNFHLSFRKIH